MSLKCKIMGHQQNLIGVAIDNPYESYGYNEIRKILRLLLVYHCQRCGKITKEVLYTWNDYDCNLLDKHRELQQNGIKDYPMFLIDYLGGK